MIDGFDSPENAAMAGFPPTHCSVITSRTQGEDACAAEYRLRRTLSVWRRLWPAERAMVRPGFFEWTWLGTNCPRSRCWHVVFLGRGARRRGHGQGRM